MYNKETGMNTTMNMYLYTAVQGKMLAGSAAILQAPSGLERCVHGSNPKKTQSSIETLNAIVAKINGNDLDVNLQTNDRYLIQMLGGEYKARLMRGEEIEYADTWSAIIRHLKAHRCHLKVVDIEENATWERCKVTARFALAQAKASVSMEVLAS